MCVCFRWPGGNSWLRFQSVVLDLVSYISVSALRLVFWCVWWRSATYRSIIRCIWQLTPTAETHKRDPFMISKHITNRMDLVLWMQEHNRVNQRRNQRKKEASLRRSGLVDVEAKMALRSKRSKPKRRFVEAKEDRGEAKWTDQMITPKGSRRTKEERSFATLLHSWFVPFSEFVCF